MLLHGLLVLKKLNTTQEEFNEQIEVTYMWD